MGRKLLRRWLLLSLACTVALPAICTALQALLGLWGSSWRPRVWTAVLALTLLAADSAILALAVWIIRAGERLHWALILAKGVVALALMVLLVIGNWWGMLLLAFSARPEHIVYENGQKLVACVNSFLDVNVDYYLWRSPLTMSEECVRTESYGSGGYDPFDGNHDDARPIGGL